MKWQCCGHSGQIPRSCCVCGTFSDHSRVRLVASPCPKTKRTKLGIYVKASPMREQMNTSRHYSQYSVLCGELDEKVLRDFHKYFLDNWHTWRHMSVHCWRGSSPHI